MDLVNLDLLLSTEFYLSWVRSKQYNLYWSNNCSVWDDLYAYCGGGPLDGIRF